MRKFTFSTTYRGDPKVALDILLQPQRFNQWMPYVRRIEVLKRPSPETLTASWEVEIDGASLTWREEVQLITERRVVKFQMIKGDFRVYQGEWTMTPQGDQVTVSLSVDLDWGAPNLSKFVAQILEQKAGSALRGMVLALGRAALHESLEIRRTVSRFGYIFHPLDLGLLAEGFGDHDLKTKRPALLERVMEWFPPFRRAVVTGIRSPVGIEVEGDMILLTLLPKQMLMLDDKFVLARLVEAGRSAERYGDKLLGLGAYAASVGHKGVVLAKQLHIPVTTGSSYTVAMVMEAIIKASQTVGVNLREAVVAIIGATGTIGHICANLIAQEARHLLLVARNQQRLEDLVQSLTGKYRSTISTLADIDAAVTNADIIITATNTPTAIIDITKVKPGAIIFEVSRPRNVSEESALLRPDVLVLDGGVVQPPGPADFHFSFGLAPGLAYACMAETMILALEGRYESYSLGGNIQLEKVKEIHELGRKHGFALAGLRSFDRGVSTEQIERVCEARTTLHHKRAASVQPSRLSP